MRIRLFLLAFLLAWIVTYPIHATASPDHLQGIVVDQDGKPVSGVKVIFQESEHVLIVPIPFWPTWESKKALQETTRADGTFDVYFNKELLGLVAVEKNGYVPEFGTMSMTWSRRPNAQSKAPYKAQIILFDLLNVNADAVLNAATSEYRFTTDGADYYVNMSSGVVTTKKSNEADLVFSVKQVGRSYWLFTVRALEGGVWGSENEMPYAPKEGYVKGFSTLYSIGAGIRYRSQYAFFAMSLDGRHYSRVIADINKQAQTIRFHYALNPTGSRFLFVPERLDSKNGFQGPPRHPDDWQQTNSGYVMLNENVPWWLKQRHNMYPIISVETFEKLMNQKDRSTHAYVAQHIYAPDAVLETFSRSQDQHDRWDVAHNAALPQVILKQLSTDTDEGVRIQANEMISRQLSIRDFLESKGFFREKAD